MDVISEEESKAPVGIDSKEAYALVTESPSGTFIVDVRSTQEYEEVGHPDMANGVPNIPLYFAPSWQQNENFVQDVLKRYTKRQSIITICRSGQRALDAAKLLATNGFLNVYYVTDSFEGQLDANGNRTIDGWLNKKLPYTHSLDKKLTCNINDKINDKSNDKK